VCLNTISAKSRPIGSISFRRYRQAAAARLVRIG
jgi:hypothetical protein